MSFEEFPDLPRYLIQQWCEGNDVLMAVSNASYGQFGIRSAALCAAGPKIGFAQIVGQTRTASSYWVRFSENWLFLDEPKLLRMRGHLHEIPLPSRIFEVKDGYRYNYVYSKAQASYPTFLLVHGFPSSIFDWRYQIRDLSAAGYGIIALDLLGYGGTDKPLATGEYTLSKMSYQVAEVLAHEGVQQVIGVGHDWGSALLGKLVDCFPELFSSLVFLSVPYNAGSFDLDSFNKQAEEAFGYPTLGYQYFFMEKDAAKVINNNLESFLSLAYPASPERWRTDLCPLGKAREWVQSNKVDSLPSWESKRDREYRLDLLKKGGIDGPLNWYKVGIDDKTPPTADGMSLDINVINVPVLFLGGDKDYATRVEILQHIAELGNKQGWLPSIKVQIIAGAGHWLTLEKPEQLFTILDQMARNLK